MLYFLKSSQVDILKLCIPSIPFTLEGNPEFISIILEMVVGGTTVRKRTAVRSSPPGLYSNFQISPGYREKSEIKIKILSSDQTFLLNAFQMCLFCPSIELTAPMPLL